LIVLIWPAIAHAHLAPPRVRADRTLTFDTTSGTLVYDVRLSGNELRRVRAEGDADGDATLSHGEVEALLARWTTELGRDVTIDGAPLSKARLLSKSAEKLEGAITDTDPYAAVAARVAWTFELGSESGTLTIEDGAGFLPFDHTDVSVRGPFLALGDDPQRMGREPRIGWVDLAKTSHRFVITYPKRPDRTAPIVIGAVATIAALLGYLGLRRFRR
jgi:hypothetical protein